MFGDSGFWFLPEHPREEPEEGGSESPSRVRSLAGIHLPFLQDLMVFLAWQ